MTYSVVVNEGISTVIYTDSEGAQQVIALDVAKGYADQIARLLNLTSGENWRAKFDNRQEKEIDFSCIYAAQFAHGTDGHNAKMIIAKFVEILMDRKE